MGRYLSVLAMLAAFLAAGGAVAVGAPFLPVISDVTPTHGARVGGALVTVSGSGFGTDSNVSWDGGAPITPVSVAAGGTSLTFTTPAHAAGLVELHVTSGGVSTEQSPLDEFWFDDVAGKPAPPPFQVGTDNPTRETSLLVTGRRIPGYRFAVYQEPAHTVACASTAGAERVVQCQVDGLTVGVHHFQATQSAPGGLTSDLSGVVEVTVLPPIPPPTIISPSDGGTLDGPTIHLRGTALPSAQLVVFSDLGECDQIVGPSGVWTCTFTVPAQPLQRTLLIDAGQIVSGPPPGKSDLRQIVVTLLIPPPTITAPTGGSSSSGPAKVRISGTGIAIGVVTVTVYDSGRPICEATVQRVGGGSWSGTATLGLGTHSLSATQRDTFGNRSRTSRAVSFSVTPPPPPQPAPRAELPATGTPVSGQITLALALTLAGLISLRAPRRRRQPDVERYRL